MKYKVRMLAFMTEAGQEPVIREVDVPDEELKGKTVPDEILGLIFYHGQNDFQPVPNRCSVSMADVIEVGDDLFAVCSVGFRKLTKDEYDRYAALSRRDRQFDNLLLPSED